MSQGSYNVPTGGTVSMVSFAGDMNAAYDALATSNSGASTPANGPSAAPLEFQAWYDTTNVNFPVYRHFDGVSWDRVGTLDIAGSNWLPQLGGGTISVASASTVNLGANPQTFITITGVVTVTNFGASAAKGEMKLVYSAGNFTIQNSASIVCPDGLNINVGIGDSFFAVYNGAGQWTVAGYTRASAKDIVFNVEDYGAKGDNSTDNTAAISAAMTAAAAAGGAVYFPAGIYITDVITVPVTLPRMYGASRGGTTLKFVRRVYGASVALIFVASNTAKFQLDTMTLDVNNVLFNNTQTIVVSLSDNTMVSNIVINGEANRGLHVSACDNCVVRDMVFFGTNDGFAACIIGDNTGGSLHRLRVEDSLFSGIFNYGCQLTAGDACSITNCRSIGNVGASFAMGMNLCTSSMIRGCHSVDSSHEAFQFTDCVNCSIIGNTCEWGSLGTDFGISINGTAAQARFNVISDNTILNSYSAGIGLADWTQYTVVSGNNLRNCGVRATAALLASASQIISYTVTASAVNIGNQIRDNLCVSESGTTTFGFSENQTGAGASVSANIVSGNYFAGVTTIFFLVSSTSLFMDDQWRTYVPTVTSGGGTITSSAVNTASYRQWGKSIEIQFDITITTVGSATGALVVTLPVSAVTNGGALAGREVAGVGPGSGKGAAGACSGGTVQLFAADVSTFLASGARVVASGVYRSV